MASLIVTPSRGGHGQVLELVRRYPHEQFYQISGYYHDLHRAAATALGNLVLLDDIREVLINTPKFDRMITFGAGDHPAHQLSFSLSMVFRKLGKPRFDVQHGLILSGYNEFIDGKIVDATIFTDKAISMAAFGPVLPFRKTFEEKRAEARNYQIGISSNLHWHVYDGKERANFLRSVATLASEFPEYEFVWRPHPAEYKFHAEARHFLPFDSLGIVKSNLRILSFDEISAQPVEDFLDGVDAVFSSVSTAMLDAEQAGVPCVTHHSRRLARSVDGFAQCALSRGPLQAVALMRRALSGDPTARFESGLPKQFDTVGFAAAVGLSAPGSKTTAPPRQGQEDEVLTAFQIYSSLASVQ